MRFGTVADREGAGRARRPRPPSASSPPATRTASAPCSSPGPQLNVMPPRFGRDQVRACSSTLAIAAAVGGPRPRRPRRRASTASARSPSAAASSPWSPTSWPTAGSTRSPGSALRHDLLAIAVHDPRELDVPPIGLVEVVDPATGAVREVRVTRRRAAALRRGRRRGGRRTRTIAPRAAPAPT